jgi:glycerol-3-phosphate dehydrogenase subunit B
MRRRRHYDAVVIGAGTAGLTAGIRLAQAGARVCVVAEGIGSTHLAAGTVDVLGYNPEPVSDPGAAVAELSARNPRHPYALIGVDTLEEALRWFSELTAAGPQAPYRYVGDLSRNFLLPTAVGALKPSALVPTTFAAGDSAQLGRVCVVAPRMLRDFHSQLCASNLEAQGVDARAVLVDVELERADENTLALARRFDDPTWRAAFAGRLMPLVTGTDQVALPAILGLRDPHGALTDLEQRLGRPVFEIPSLPPSVPGMRLYETLRAALLNAGGLLARGAAVVAHARHGDRIVSVSAQTAGAETEYSADLFVLAAGGFHSGAITLDSHWQTHELLFDLPLAGLPEVGAPRFVGSYLDEQPMARVGVAVDASLHALGAANVLVAGAALPGAIPWREASGEGIALASGYRAAATAMAEHGSRTEAPA